MSFGTEQMNRASRRILAAMIVAGALLTGLSFAMQVDPGAVKSKVHGIVDHAGTLMDGSR